MATEVAAIFEAVRAGDLGSVAALLAANPALAGARNEQGLSVRMQACYFRRADLFELLMGAGPPADIFEASAFTGQVERGKALLDADPSLATAWSPDGFTPLHLAAYFGQDEMAKFLVDHGADVNAVSRNPMALQPLHSAASSRSAGIVRLLLERGAAVNAKQHGGYTPLHAAASNGDVATTELLLSFGANPEQTTDDHRTPIDFAREKGAENIVSLLRSGESD
jgi:ankyrin repeat protein